MRPGEIALVERVPRWPILLRGWASSDRSRWLRGKPNLIATYTLSRLLLVLIPIGILPYPYGSEIPNDVYLYSAWADVIMAGHFPVSDPMWQYPPLAGFVFLLTAGLTQSPLVGFIGIALAVDFTIFLLLLRTGAGRLDGAWTYAIAGIAIGPVMLTRFDLFPTLFVVLALLSAQRPIRSGAMLGIGALLKVWPVLLLVAWPRRNLPKLAAATLSAGLVGMALLYMWGPGLMSFMNEQSERGLQIESTGGALYILAQLLGIDIATAFRYGSMEIHAVGAAAIATLMTLAGGAAFFVIGYRRLRGRIESVSVPDIALILVLVSIAASRVFSPQYMIWVAGVAAVCMLDPKTRMRPIVLMLFPVALLAQLVYPWLYGQMVNGEFFGSLFQLARIVLLVAATCWGLRLILKPRSPLTDRIDLTNTAAQRELA